MIVLRSCESDMEADLSIADVGTCGLISMLYDFQKRMHASEL